MSTGADALIADALGEWAAGFRLAEAPARVGAEALRCIVDVTGVSLAGARHPLAESARARARRTYAPGPCTLAGERGVGLCAPGAAFANGVAAHAWDFDDVSYDAMVHASAVVWPAVLAAGEGAGISGAAALEAFVTGVEGEYALARALTPELFWRGWWTTGLLGGIGAALGAAKAGGLDAAASAAAVRIAATQAGGPYVLVGSPLKPYACGRAAEIGVQAAAFASDGLTGPPDVFENGAGFVALFGAGRLDPAPLDALGTDYLLQGKGVAFKRYPVCAGAQSALEALAALVAGGEHRFDARGEVRLRCEVTPEVMHYMPFASARTVNEAQFCLPYCLACVWVHGTLAIDHLDTAALRDPTVGEAMLRIDCVERELQSWAQDDPRCDQPARVTLVDGGSVLGSQRVLAATGMPGNPLADADLQRKFLDCAVLAMPMPAAAAMLERLRGIGELARVRELWGEDAAN